MVIKVATLTREKKEDEERCRDWVDKLEAKQQEVQGFKEDFEKAAKDVVKKYNGHLDEMGIQSWLARVEAMEEYAEGSMLIGIQTLESLAYERLRSVMLRRLPLMLFS